MLLAADLMSCSCTGSPRIFNTNPGGQRRYRIETYARSEWRCSMQRCTPTSRFSAGSKWGHSSATLFEAKLV